MSRRASEAVSYWVNIHAAEGIAQGPNLVETVAALLNISPTEVLLDDMTRT